MVVKGEALVGLLVVDVDAQQVGMVGLLQRQLEAQFAVEEQLVVAIGERITLGQVVDGAVDAVG